MNIIVCDPNPLVIDNLDRNVDSFLGTFEELDSLLQGHSAAIANAGNGYGIMGAGIAGAIAFRFPKTKWSARAKLGVVPAKVGTSFVIGTEDPSSAYRYVIYTVTMEDPGTVLSESDHVPYEAMRATLRAADDFNRHRASGIETLVVPGFGGGVGRLSPRFIAYELSTAIYEYQEGIGYE